MTAETFGHEPVEYDGVPICQRCWTGGQRSTAIRQVVPWPCTSAVVLGLVVCPEDHGDPFGWWNPPVPAVAPPAAPDGPQGVRSLIARMRSAPRTKP